MSSFKAESENDGATVLGQGSFVGDVDKLISTDENVSHSTTLICQTAGSVFTINKHDLQAFLLENPGILMSLSGKVYVR